MFVKDAEEMQDAITPSGSYQINGEQIKVTLRLVKNNAVVKTLNIEGTKQNLNNLIEQIVKAIGENAK